MQSNGRDWFVELMWFILWNTNPCCADFSPLKHLSSGELLGWCTSPTALSAASSVTGSQLSTQTHDSILVRRQMLLQEEEGNSQATWQTEQTLVSSKKQWSDSEMQFKNLLSWGGKRSPKEQSSLRGHLLKQQLPNTSHRSSRDMQSNEASTIGFIQNIPIYIIAPQWLLSQDKDLPVLTVVQRTPNSPDKITVETRGWREEKGLIWLKDLLAGSCMCLGFSLCPRILLCEIHSEWTVKRINFPIYGLVMLSLRPSRDLMPDEAFQERIYWGVIPFVSISHTIYCLCRPSHLVQTGPVTTTKNVNEDTTFSCTEGMEIQGDLPQSVPGMAKRVHGWRKRSRRVEVGVEEAAAGRKKVASWGETHLL